jgi:hypothetical protein
MKNKKYTFLILFGFLALTVFSQDNKSEVTTYTKNTFYANRLINGHSVELTPAGRLDLKFSHRMGRVNNGAYDLFGLDQAILRIGLEYGCNEWLMFGVGRSSFEKLYDGFVKVKFLRQSEGKKNMPITATWFSGMYLNSLKWANPDRTNYFSSRISYAHQLLVARKFNDRLSLQLTPTLVHHNLVLAANDKNDIFSIGCGGRYRVFNHIAVTAEYYYVLPNQIKSQLYGTDVANSFSLGFDIYTGKHVFQIMVTNSTTMIEKGFITQTTDKWKDGNLHIGFNILRLFNIANK